MTQMIPATAEGHHKLIKELKRLREIERPKNVEDIERARELGDLSENAEYHAAKERQSFIEGAIRDLEDKLSRIQVIDPASINSDKVVFGATVQLYDVDNDAEVTYKIVGDFEANVSANKISISSPLARALIGKEEGDEVTFQSPGGKRNYEIISIEYK